jgi:transposase
LELQVVVEDSGRDVVMLGLPGMRVLDAEPVGGELEVTVETIDATGWCRNCGVKARSKGRRDTLVRDVAAFDRPVRLRWRKRRWQCPEPQCPARTWTETHDHIAPRAVLTDRAQRAACRRAFLLTLTFLPAVRLLLDPPTQGAKAAWAQASP